MMTTQTGIAFLLKTLDCGEPIHYSTIAGLRTTHISINGDLVVVTHKEPGWRDLVPKSGNRSVSIGAAGIFMSGDAGRLIQSHALSGIIDDYELSFEDGTKWRGRFLVQRLDYSGDFNGERNYTIQLESSGPVEVRA